MAHTKKEVAIDEIIRKLVNFGQWAQWTDPIVTKREGVIEAEKLAEEIYTIVEGVTSS